jgi:hypothetical protein
MRWFSSADNYVKIQLQTVALRAVSALEAGSVLCDRHRSRGLAMPHARASL